MNDRPTGAKPPHLRLLDAVSPQTRETFQRASTLVRLEKGRFLWLAGDPAECVYFQLSGFCQIVTDPAAETPASVALGTPGQLLGEAEVIAGSLRDSEAVIREDATFVRIGAGPFLDMIERDMTLCRMMLLIANVKFITMLEYSGVMQVRSAESRTAYVICLVSDLCGVVDNNGTAIPFPLSQQTLAAYAGSTRQTVNRLLTKWSSEGVLATDGGYLHVREPQRLRTLAGVSRSTVPLTLAALMDRLQARRPPAR